MSASVDVLTTSRAATVQKIVSKGGLEAWLVEDYAVPLVAFDFAFKGGASQDEKNKPGIATMLAGLLDEGAGSLDADAFHRALDDKAIELSFSADRDNIQGRLKTLTRDIDAAFEMLRLAVNDARLDPDAIDRMRAQLSAGLRHELKDPDAVASRLWREAAFPGHPYGAPGHGSLESLPTIGRDDLLAARDRQLSRRGLKIAVVGAIDGVRLAPLLDKVFGALPAKSDLRPVADIVMGHAGERFIERIDLPQSTIRFGLRGIARKDADYMSAVVVNHVLGGGVFSARLFKEVREKRGLAYHVSSQLATHDHAAILSGGTSTKNERAAESLSVIEEEIAKMAAEGPTEEELDKAKKFLIGSYALRFDTSTKIAAQLVQLQLEGFDVTYLDERNRLVAAVTLADAKRVAKRLFENKKLLVSVAGKPEGM